MKGNYFYRCIELKLRVLVWAVLKDKAIYCYRSPECLLKQDVLALVLHFYASEIIYLQERCLGCTKKVISL